MDQPSTSKTDAAPETLGPETNKLIQRVSQKLQVEIKPQAELVVPISDPVSRAARYTGMHKKNIEKMLASGRPLEVEHKEVNRRLIHKELISMYLVKKCIPTITQLFDASHHLLPYADVDYFTKMLIKMGYVFYKYPDQRALRVMERKSVTFERYKYLKAIQRHREKNLPIVYIGVASRNTTKEFLNLEKSLQLDKQKTVQRVFFTATENEIKHVKLVYSITSEVLKLWLINYVLHDLASGTVCILDDLDIYRETLIDVPTLNSVKADMLEWLAEHNIPCDVNMTKSELMDLVQTYTDVNKNTYVIDNIVKTYDHKLLRLPKCIKELSIVDPILRFFNSNSILKNVNLATINAIFDCISRVQLNLYSDCIQQEEQRLLKEDIELDNVLDELVRNTKSIITIEDDDG